VISTKQVSRFELVRAEGDNRLGLLSSARLDEVTSVPGVSVTSDDYIDSTDFPPTPCFALRL